LIHSKKAVWMVRWRIQSPVLEKTGKELEEVEEC